MTRDRKRRGREGNPSSGEPTGVGRPVRVSCVSSALERAGYPHGGDCLITSDAASADSDTGSIIDFGPPPPILHAPDGSRVARDARDGRAAGRERWEEARGGQANLRTPTTCRDRSERPGARASGGWGTRRGKRALDALVRLVQLLDVVFSEAFSKSALTERSPTHSARARLGEARTMVSAKELAARFESMAKSNEPPPQPASSSKPPSAKKLAQKFERRRSRSTRPLPPVAPPPSRLESSDPRASPLGE